MYMKKPKNHVLCCKMIHEDINNTMCKTLPGPDTTTLQTPPSILVKSPVLSSLAEMLPLKTWRKSTFFRSAGFAVNFAMAPSGKDLKASFTGANKVYGPSVILIFKNVKKKLLWINLDWCWNKRYLVFTLLQSVSQTGSLQRLYKGGKAILTGSEQQVHNACSVSRSAQTGSCQKQT